MPLQPHLRLGRLSSKCNRGGEDFKGGTPEETFARSVIDKIENTLEFSLRNIEEIAALGEERTKQAIGIFIAASLPGLMRLGEENRSIELTFKFPKLCKFRTIVKRKAVNREAFEGIHNGHSGFRCIFRMNNPCTDVTASAVNERNNRAFTLGAAKGIAFPITDT